MVTFINCINNDININKIPEPDLIPSYIYSYIYYINQNCVLIGSTKGELISYDFEKLLNKKKIILIFLLMIRYILILKLKIYYY